MCNAAGLKYTNTKHQVSATWLLNSLNFYATNKGLKKLYISQ